MNVAAVEWDKRHGGPYDRGQSDSYYGWVIDPHYYVADTMMSRRVEASEMTDAEIAAYVAGYEDNERDMMKKDWG